MILETSVIQNNLLETVPRLSTEWSVSLNLQINSIGNQFTNVFHFTIGSNLSKYGDRVPAVWFRPRTSRLYISAPINGNADYVFEDHQSGALHLGQSYHLEIHHRYLSNGNYRYLIKLDGVEIHSIINKDARQFYNVKLYAGDPWYPPMHGTISDFQFTNFL